MTILYPPRLLVVAVAGWWLAILAPVSAEETSGIENSRTEAIAQGDVVLEGVEAMRVAIALAHEAIREGEHRRSREMLEAVVDSESFVLLAEVDRVAALFSLGQSYNLLDQHPAAIRSYRRILAEFPGLVRVRLELARSFFLIREDTLADYHFRMVLAGDLPAAVAANVRYYLREIRNRRRWSFDLDFSVLHNTNVNVAPTIQQIELFGLPFELDDEARAKSGLGLSVRTIGEYRQPFRKNARLRVGTQISHTHYRQNQFNETILAGHLGPQFSFEEGPLGETSLSLLVQGYRRWYGGRKLNRGVGPAVEITVEPRDRLHLSARLEHFDIQYDANGDYDGTYTNLSLLPVIVLSPTSYGIVTLGAAYDRTDEARLRNWQYRAGLGYLKEFSSGFTAGIYPEYRYHLYEREWPAFDERRRDHLFHIRINLLNRRIDWKGFTPVLEYRYQIRDSTISLYDFDQHRMELSATRKF